MNQTEKLKKVFVIIGIVLIISVIQSIYTVNESVKGYETIDAICIDENILHDNIRQRIYTYTVNGQKYKIIEVEANTKPNKFVKYDPANPSIAKSYGGNINLDSIVVLLVGFIFVFNPFIINFVNNNEKIYEIKDKIITISKRNILKIITICFWVYMLFSVVGTLISIASSPEWSTAILEYSLAEIIMECAIFFIARCHFT